MLACARSHCIRCDDRIVCGACIYMYMIYPSLPHMCAHSHTHAHTHARTHTHTHHTHTRSHKLEVHWRGTERKRAFKNCSTTLSYNSLVSTRATTLNSTSLRRCTPMENRSHFPRKRPTKHSRQGGTGMNGCFFPFTTKMFQDPLCLH